MLHLFSVMIGGALGALLRYGVQLIPLIGTGARFPIGTLLVNALASFFAGATFIWLMQHSTFRPEWRSFLLVGLLGSLSTFSAFSLESLLMFQESRWKSGLAYIFISIVLCFLMAGAGVLLGRKL